MSAGTRKNRYFIVTLAALVALFAVVGSAAAASNLWLHVKVDEKDGAKVSVNLPLALAEKALPMIPKHGNFDWHHGHHGSVRNIDDLREIWAEVQASPDMTFVTVEEEDENVKVWKKAGYLYVEVREGDDERVDVQIPLAVVDALLSGDEINFEAAVKALAERGGGELVSVRDKEDNVRVWIDDNAESK